MAGEDRRRQILEAAEAREAARRQAYAEEAAEARRPGHFLRRSELAERRDLGQGKFHAVLGMPLKWW